MTDFKSNISLLGIYKNLKLIGFILSLVLLALHPISITAAQDWPIGPKLPGMRIAVNPTQSLIAVSGEQGIAILKADNLTNIIILSSTTVFVTDMEWSPDGQRIAIAGDYKINIWELDTTDNSFQFLKTIAVLNDPSDYDLGISL